MMKDEAKSEAKLFLTRTTSMKVVNIVDDGAVYRLSNHAEYRDLLDVLEVKLLVDVETKQ